MSSKGSKKSAGRSAPMWSGPRWFLAILLVMPAMAVQGVAAAGEDERPEVVCTGDHLLPPADDKTSFVYTAPDGYLVSGWCVKAGPQPEYHHADDGHEHDLPAAKVTIEHSSGKDVSHFSVVLVPRPFSKPLTISNAPAATYDVDHDWRVEKSVDRTSAAVAEGGTAAFTYTVRLQALPGTRSGHRLGGVVSLGNPHSTGVVATVATAITGGSACTIAATDGSADVGLQVTLEPGTTELAYTCPLAPDPADGSTTATVSWDPATYPQEAAGATYTRSATTAYTFVVDQRTDTRTTVTDTFDGGTAEHLGTFDWDAVWAANDQHTVVVKTYTRDLGSDPGACTTYPNTAREDADGTQDSEHVTVCEKPVEAPLTATATASADLARAYAWSVDKVVDAAERTVDTAGSARFRYTVTARAGAATDSGWRLTGAVTASNPNTHDGGAITLTGVTVATDLGGGSACTAALPGSPVVPAGSAGTPGTLTVPFSCTFAGAPSASGTVTATVGWDPAGEDTSESLTVTRPVAFAVRSETDEVVDVVDDKTVPGQRVVLAEDVVWEPGLVRTFTYDLTVAGGAAGECATHTNTARVDLSGSPDPTATATVRACTPPPEVLLEQAFGKAVGAVTSTCQGTVRARLGNRTGQRVVYTLRVGSKTHRVAVRSGARKTYVTSGKARARVVLKVEGRVLDRLRIQDRCAPPEVLPQTGFRVTSL